jgi:tRNA-specific 2-thiouridylase
VVELDAATNRVVVGDESQLDRGEFIVERCNWIAFETPPQSLRAMVKIRYNHPGASGTIIPQANGGARIKLDVPQRAITPGQACVFYQEDLVLGGGWIVH